MADRGRPRRSPGRYLAPLALAATLAGIYLVVSNGLHSSPGRSPSTTQRHHASTGSSTTTHKRSTSDSGGAVFYVIRPGDTLSGIALRTHVLVATIERLNPGVAANALRVGQRLRLRR